MINCFITFRKCLRNNSIRTNSASVFTILDIKHTLVRFFGEVPQTIYLPQIYDLNWFKRRQWHSTQYSFLENPMDRGAWGAALHGVAKSQTRLSDFTITHWRRKWQPTPVFLPGESQGRGSLVDCHLWGLIESDTTEAT